MAGKHQIFSSNPKTKQKAKRCWRRQKKQSFQANDPDKTKVKKGYTQQFKKKNKPLSKADMDAICQQAKKSRKVQSSSITGDAIKIKMPQEGQARLSFYEQEENGLKGGLD